MTQPQITSTLLQYKYHNCFFYVTFWAKNSGQSRASLCQHLNSNIFFISENHSITISMAGNHQVCDGCRSFVLKVMPGRKVLVFVWVFCLQSFQGFAGASGRVKRELRFPKGSSLSVSVALASFLPKGPTDGFAHVLEFDLGFPFPENFSIDKKKSEKRIWVNPEKAITKKDWYKSKTKPYKKFRGKRSLKDKERENAMLKIENLITRMGFNGTSCTSRMQCELRNISPQNSLLEELLVALFKPPSEPNEKECKENSNNCPISILHIIMHSKQIPATNLV